MDDKLAEQIASTQKDLPEAILYGNLFRTVAQLTEVCVANGKDPLEVAEIYSKLYDLVAEQWFKATPQKEKFMEWLEVVFPSAK